MTFEELPNILNISSGYARKVIADLVEKKIFLTEKDELDKRKMIYSLNWVGLRNYLLNIPNDYDEIILNIVDPKFNGKFVALDEFKVIEVADNLSTLTQKVGYIKRNQNILITHVGDPVHKIVLETE